MSSATSPKVYIDPELEAARALMPRPPEGWLDFNDMAATRARMAARRPVFPPNEGVEAQDRLVPGAAGDPEVTLRIYRSKTASAATRLPAIYWIHGGGMIMGYLDGDNVRLSEYVEQIGCVAVSVDYRLAPEHPHPALVNDCYAGLVWTVAHAEDLGIDPARIVIGGASAGGGLAAATSLMARDRGGPALSYQFLIYPMLDDRNITPSSHEILDVGVWDRATNISGWRALLGAQAGTEGVSPYAAPARATDLAGLPPAFIDVGTADLFRDEDIDYAQRLMAAGVPAELHVYPGAFHGFEGVAPNAGLTQAARSLRLAALRRAMAG
jgi:acetyl esterase/lipase